MINIWYFTDQGVKGIPVIERSFRVKPSQRPASLEVFYIEGAENMPIKAGQDITGVCGELIKGLSKWLPFSTSLSVIAVIRALVI